MAAATLVAVATDGTSQLAGEAVLVGVNNAASMKPSVRITQPFYDPSDVTPIPISGVTNLAASAVDLGPVAGVDFYFGQTFIGSGVAGAGEWTLLWDTALVADAAYSLTAVATGADGSQGVSAPIPVAVRNHAIHVGGLHRRKIFGRAGNGPPPSRTQFTMRRIEPVAGATVFATWTPVPGSSRTMPVSATTDANGQCCLRGRSGRNTTRRCSKSRRSIHRSMRIFTTMRR